MAISTDTKKSQRIKALIKEFGALYPEPKTELIFKNEYQLLISVILSAQCTDKKVNQVTPVLFARCPDFKSLSQADLTTVEEIIRPINYYRTKSKHLIAMAKRVITEYAGEIPLDYKNIRTLPGVGNKTANVVLGELGIIKTLPVDTHVFRVSQRLALASGKTPEAIEEQLKKLFDPELWNPLHHWLILHGRRICKAQRPLCASCRLRKLCPARNDDLD